MEVSPMHTFRQILSVPLIVGLVSSTPVFAQQRHIVDQSSLAQTVEQRAAQQDADRDAIREALSQPEVLEAARHFGVDVNRMNASVATLTGSDLERAATAARQVNERLAGGASTVVISTTTIIIALLVVILLIVALK
jgi:hypothetical protein